MQAEHYSPSGGVKTAQRFWRGPIALHPALAQPGGFELETSVAYDRDIKNVYSLDPYCN